jgi:hypothetical protein
MRRQLVDARRHHDLSVPASACIVDVGIGRISQSLERQQCEGFEGIVVDRVGNCRPAIGMFTAYGNAQTYLFVWEEGDL